MPINIEKKLTPHASAGVGITVTSGVLVALNPVYVAKDYRMFQKTWPPLNTLHRGAFVSGLSGGPAFGINFLVESLVQKYFSESGFLEGVAINGATGAVSSFLTTVPIERVTAYQRLRGGTSMEVTKIIVRVGGMRNLTLGSGPTMLRDGVMNIAFFTLLDRAKGVLSPWVKNEYAKDVAASLVVGGLAGALTTPLDRIRTLQQGVLQKNKGQTAFSMLKELGGRRDLYFGWQFRAFALGLMILGMDTSKRELTRHLPESMFIKP